MTKIKETKTEARRRKEEQTRKEKMETRILRRDGAPIVTLSSVGQMGPKGNRLNRSYSTT
jgi:hypothetical protein